MKIDKRVKRELKHRNIELIKEKTGKALRVYNQTKNMDVIAGLHLTC